MKDSSTKPDFLNYKAHTDYLASQAKSSLSALDLKRQLDVSYPTAWLIQLKLMQAMVGRDAQYTLDGDVQVDEAYLGG